MSRFFILAHPEARRRAVEALQTAPDGYVVRISTDWELRYKGMTIDWDRLTYDDWVGAGGIRQAA